MSITHAVLKTTADGFWRGSPSSAVPRTTAANHRDWRGARYPALVPLALYLNPEGQFFGKIRALESGERLLMTGTPQNNAVVLPVPHMVLRLIAAAPQVRMFFGAAQMILNVHAATIYRLSTAAV
jgi:hypothetical protein